MSNHYFVRITGHTLAAVALAALVACGGGTSLGDGGVSFEGNPLASNPGPLGALAQPTARIAAARTPDVSSFLNWAEIAYPEFFSSKEANLISGIYTYRYYPKTDIALGVSTAGDVLALRGTGAGNYESIPLGKIADFGCAVFPADCAPTTPTTPPSTGTGSYNECTDPAAQALPTGFTTLLTFTYTGLITGEQTVETRVEGSASFEGQSAIKVLSTTTGTNTIAGQTITLNTSTSAYQQIQNGLANTLGAEIVVTNPSITVSGFTIPGSVISSKTVYSPPLEDREFTIKAGESITINSKGTTSIVNPPSSSAFNFNTIHTYVARETVAVGGRSFDACKYTVKDSSEASSNSTIWFMVGKGVPVKTEVITEEGTQQILLKSGTYNGVAL